MSFNQRLKDQVAAHREAFESPVAAPVAEGKVLGWQDGGYLIQQGGNTRLKQSATNGALATGAVVAARGRVDGQRSKPNPTPSPTLIPQRKALGNIKILYSTIEGDELTFWIGGHRSSQISILSIPIASTVVNAVISNTGTKQDAYIVNIGWLNEAGIAQMAEFPGGEIPITWNQSAAIDNQYTSQRSYQPNRIPLAKGHGFLTHSLTGDIGTIQESYSVAGDGTTTRISVIGSLLNLDGSVGTGTFTLVTPPSGTGRTGSYGGSAFLTNSVFSLHDGKFTQIDDGFYTVLGYSSRFGFVTGDINSRIHEIILPGYSKVSTAHDLGGSSVATVEYSRVDHQTLIAGKGLASAVYRRSTIDWNGSADVFTIQNWLVLSDGETFTEFLIPASVNISYLSPTKAQLIDAKLYQIQGAIDSVKTQTVDNPSTVNIKITDLITGEESVIQSEVYGLGHDSATIYSYNYVPN
jgi:hypothetical protein